MINLRCNDVKVKRNAVKRNRLSSIDATCGIDTLRLPVIRILH
jgi:hypothetical protein